MERSVAANPIWLYGGKGKTEGTTEANFRFYKADDQWIVGYTPNVSYLLGLGFGKKQ